jgi:hypothetical protein
MRTIAAERMMYTYGQERKALAIISSPHITHRKPANLWDLFQFYWL